MKAKEHWEEIYSTHKKNLIKRRQVAPNNLFIVIAVNRVKKSLIGSGLIDI